jgi:hypothetical protein
MALRARRVVTGHDQQGRAVVVSDEVWGKAVSARPAEQRSTGGLTSGGKMLQA